MLNSRASLPCLRRAAAGHQILSHKYNTLPRPSRKMKTINWTKLPSQLITDGSVWGGLRESEPSLEVDFRQLDELFCQPGRPKSAPASAAPGSAAPASSAAPPSVHLLDSRRSLALSILLKQYKAGPSAVVQAVQRGSGLKAETLRALVRLLPEKHELAMIRSHPCEPENLAMAERFYLDLSNVENYELRIRAMLQKEEVPVTVEEFEPQLRDILNCSKNLMENSSLKEFLALVLQLGNYLNSGSYAGEAVGFRLGDLPKLLETRANLPRVTFLHYVVQVALSHKRDSLSFTDHLPELRQAARVPLSAIEEEIHVLALGIRNLKKQLESASEEIQQQFSDFMSRAGRSVAALESLLGEVRAASERLAGHFCEDPTTFQLEECFTLFADFFAKTIKASQENEQRKKQEEQRAKMESERTKSRLLSKKKKRGSGGGRLEKEEECLVDLMMQEIRGGTFKLRSLPVGQG